MNRSLKQESASGSASEYSAQVSHSYDLRANIWTFHDPMYIRDSPVASGIGQIA